MHGKRHNTIVLWPSLIISLCVRTHAHLLCWRHPSSSSVSPTPSACVDPWVHACVRDVMRACMHARTRVCVRVHACVCMYVRSCGVWVRAAYKEARLAPEEGCEAPSDARARSLVCPPAVISEHARIHVRVSARGLCGSYSRASAVNPWDVTVSASSAAGSTPAAAAEAAPPFLPASYLPIHQPARHHPNRAVLRCAAHRGYRTAGHTVR